MKNKILTAAALIIFISLLLEGCTTLSYESVYPTLADGKYDSEFPYKSTSEELAKISETIQRVNSTAFYKIYIFDAKSNYTLADLRGKSLDKIASSEALADNSSAGTAVTVYSGNNSVALLTCAHTVTFPDTIIAYRLDEKGTLTNYIESISFKEKQVIYVAGFPEGSQVEIVAKNDKLDIAILGRKFTSSNTRVFPVFNYPLGKAKEVEWGTFVYLLGYPINYKIITKAIVSSPRRDESGSFLVDAVINPGFSGGLVLAIRDGVPNFELIGMVQWVPEEEENLIFPDKSRDKAIYNPVVPYKGDIFVRKYSSIKYGIAKIIPVETLMSFLNENKNLLDENGFFVFQ
jgi:hypothetical protein